MKISKSIEKQVALESARIVGKIAGSPCYESTLTIEIFSGDLLLYQYVERFKPHVAVHWENLTEEDALSFLVRETEDYHFIDCNKLPKIEQTGDLPVFGDLLVSRSKYKQLQESNCRAFIHTYKHYEGNRIVVFSSDNSRPIVVR